MANLALCAQHLSSNLLWRIGDGWLVKIYGDPWVPHYLTFIVQSLPCLPKYSRVSALITATGHWNVSKVYCLFTFLEAELIMSIPLSYDTRDRRIWYFTRNAEYMVNSEYWAALELKLSPKMQHFLWRLAHNALPTREVLYMRKISQDNLYFHCMCQVETA